jgi:hypothetical protein
MECRESFLLDGNSTNKTLSILKDLWAMPTSVLATKLYIPPTRPQLVLRPRLINWLNEGLLSGRKLTIISAPAGFGKTTLVSE